MVKFLDLLIKILSIAVIEPLEILVEKWTVLVKLRVANSWLIYVFYYNY